MKSEELSYVSSIDYLDIIGNTESVTLTNSNFYGNGCFIIYLKLVKKNSKWTIFLNKFTRGNQLTLFLINNNFMFSDN